MKNCSLRGVNEHFEPDFSAAWPSTVVSQASLEPVQSHSRILETLRMRKSYPRDISREQFEIIRPVAGKRAQENLSPACRPPV